MGVSWLKNLQTDRSEEEEEKEEERGKQEGKEGEEEEEEERGRCFFTSWTTIQTFGPPRGR